MLYVFGCLNPGRASLFQTGWFVESLITQTFIVHVIRTNRSLHPGPGELAVTMTTLTIMGLAVWLPTRRLLRRSGSPPLPPLYWPILLARSLHVILTHIVKMWLMESVAVSGDQPTKVRAPRHAHGHSGYDYRSLTSIVSVLATRLLGGCARSPIGLFGRVVTDRRGPSPANASVSPRLLLGAGTFPQRTFGPHHQLGEQTLSAYRNGIRIARSSISSGRKGRSTPAGVFTILWIEVTHFSNRFSSCAHALYAAADLAGDRTP